YLRNAGIPTYGHSGLAGDVDDVRIHGRDERVLVKSFFDGQEYLYRLVKMLSGGGEYIQRYCLNDSHGWRDLLRTRLSLQLRNLPHYDPRIPRPRLLNEHSEAALAQRAELARSRYG